MVELDFRTLNSTYMAYLTIQSHFEELFGRVAALTTKYSTRPNSTAQGITAVVDLIFSAIVNLIATNGNMASAPQDPFEYLRELRLSQFYWNRSRNCFIVNRLRIPPSRASDVELTSPATENGG